LKTGAASTKPVIVPEHCYMLQLLAEFLTNTPIYKIGKSKNIEERLKVNEYKNARVIMICEVSDCTRCESDIIFRFMKNYEQVLESKNSNFGTEFFRGELEDMREDFSKICKKYACN
jgi:hypothetical protein